MLDAGAHCGWRLSCPSPEPRSLFPPGPLPTSPHTARPQLLGKQRGLRVHSFSPALSQGCGAELAPAPAFSWPPPSQVPYSHFPSKARVLAASSQPRGRTPSPELPCSGLHQSQLDPSSNHARPDGLLSSLNYFQKGSSVPELSNQEDPGDADPAHVGQKVGGVLSDMGGVCVWEKGGREGSQGPS